MSITRIQSVSGYSHVGCFGNSATTYASTLGSQDFASVIEVSMWSILQATSRIPNRLTPQFCCDWCVHVDPEYTFCGVQDHRTCYCDSSTPSNLDSHTAPASDCSRACLGGDFACGGDSALGLYQATNPISSIEVPDGTLTPQSLAGFTQVGCMSDADGTGRILATSSTFSLNGPEFCCEYCSHIDSNNQWCGVEDGSDCWCGSTTVLHLPAPAGDCSVTCLGGGGYQCGGNWRMNLYRVTGLASTTNLPDSTATRNSISATNTSGTSESQSGSGGGLGGGAIAGIIVGVLALVALFAAAAFFLVRRRRSQVPSGYTAGDTSKEQGATAEMLTQANTHELQGAWQRRAETDAMPGQDTRTYELPSTARIVALE